MRRWRRVDEDEVVVEAFASVPGAPDPDPAPLPTPVVVHQLQHHLDFLKLRVRPILAAATV